MGNDDGSITEFLMLFKDSSCECNRSCVITHGIADNTANGANKDDIEIEIREKIDFEKTSLIVSIWLFLRPNVLYSCSVNFGKNKYGDFRDDLI